MSDKDKLEMLLSNKAPCIETLGGKALKFQSEPPQLEMEFEAIPEFCHSANHIVQGGFVTGMLDAPMAHLLIALFDGEFYPATLDINVSFLGPSHPGKLVCIARILKLGKSIVYLASELYQKDKLVATATSTVKLVRNPS
tara:strand:- start:8389 stop:8808 length:420 start_codon:yes stop_codon:yes gene_type:complete